MTGLITTRTYHDESEASKKAVCLLDDKLCQWRLALFMVWERAQIVNAIIWMIWAISWEVIEMKEYLALKEHFWWDKFQMLFPDFYEANTDIWESHEIDASEIKALWELVQAKVNVFIQEYSIYEHLSAPGWFKEHYKFLKVPDTLWTLIASNNWEQLYLQYEWKIYSYEHYLSNHTGTSVMFFLFCVEGCIISYDVENGKLSEIEWEYLKGLSSLRVNGVISLTDTHEILTVLETWDIIKKERLTDEKTSTFIHIGHLHPDRDEVIIVQLAMETTFTQVKKDKRDQIQAWSEAVFVKREIPITQITSSDDGEVFFETSWQILRFLTAGDQTYVVERTVQYDEKDMSGKKKVVQIYNLINGTEVLKIDAETQYEIYDWENSVVIITHRNWTTDFFDLESELTSPDINDLRVSKERWGHSIYFTDRNWTEVSYSTAHQRIFERTGINGTSTSMDLVSTIH